MRTSLPAALSALFVSAVAGTALAQTPASSLSSKATFALDSSRVLGSMDKTESGFFSGLRGFEHFYDPIGNPLYFETPFNNTSVRLLYIYHGFPDDSQIDGGQVNVAAVQVRLALTERLGFIATKDGYSWFDSGLTGSDDGWNSISAGLKYAFYVDREGDLVATAGFRYMFSNSGENKVLQGDVDEISPFISFAKGWDKFRLMGNFTARIPFDGDDGNSIVQWDLHADYEIAPGIAPMLELHGLHYVSDGDRFEPLTVGGLDYSNLGSGDVSGSTVVWFDVGARIKLTPSFSFGGAFGYPLTNRDADIFGERVTLDFTITF